MIELLSITYKTATREEIWSNNSTSLAHDIEAAKQFRRKNDLKTEQANKPGLLRKLTGSR